MQELSVLHYLIAALQHEHPTHMISYDIPSAHHRCQHRLAIYNSPQQLDVTSCLALGTQSLERVLGTFSVNASDENEAYKTLTARAFGQSDLWYRCIGQLNYRNPNKLYILDTS